MRQREDCGCSGLVTPTAEQLLAVARGAKVPRIRERQPSPAKVAATMKGWVRWGLIDRSGREVRGGEGPNLILDQGLDQIATQALILELGGTGGVVATYFPIIRYAAVGTDSTAPATTDTALGAEVGRVDTAYQTEAFTRAANGVYQLTRYVEFGFDEANGNLTEWGFSYSGTGPGLLFNRALFLDGLGSPEVVSKTADYKLRLIYTLEIALSPVTLTAGSFAVTGVGTVNGDYMLVGGASPTTVTDGNMRCVAPDLKVFSGLARGSFETPASNLSTRYRKVRILVARSLDQSGVAYADTGGAVGSDDTAGGAMIADATGAARDAYSSGAFTRTGGTWKFGTNAGNLAPVKAFGVSIGESYNSGLSWCSNYGYVFDLDLASEFTKDNEHTLTVGVPTVSWGRA